MTSPNPDATRQSTLDEHVRSRIQAELARLQSEEDIVRRQIETALEKENLDKEVAHAGKEGEKPVISSSGLKDDLEDIQKRAERYLIRKKMEDKPEIKAKQELLLKCYQ